VHVCAMWRVALLAFVGLNVDTCHILKLLWVAWELLLSFASDGLTLASLFW
jgi:hypothetical protein